MKLLYYAHFVKDNNIIIHVVALISEMMLHALFCVCNVSFHCFIERVSLSGYYNIPPSLYDFVWVSAIQLIRILSVAVMHLSQLSPSQVNDEGL